MQLYTAKLSPFAARCRMQIYAKDIIVDLLEYPTEISKEDIATASPLAKIPVLLDQDQVIPESDTICAYLEECFPEPSLLAETVAERARMRLLCRIADLYIMASLTPLFAHLSRKHRDQNVVDDGLERLRAGMTSLEHFIGDGTFAVGNRLSLADCSLVPILLFVVTYLPYFGIDEPLAAYPKIAAYWNSIQLNPHAAIVIEEIRAGIREKSGK
tara:strand:- start:196108 stop:196749 length:642 start_codon:yes stop_codon:yes gene_type:complete